MDILDLIPSYRQMRQQRDAALAHADECRDAIANARHELAGIRAEVARLQSVSVRELVAAARARELPLLPVALKALKRLDAAFCAEEFGTRQGRIEARGALVEARQAIAQLEVAAK